MPSVQGSKRCVHNRNRAYKSSPEVSSIPPKPLAEELQEYQNTTELHSIRIDITSVDPQFTYTSPRESNLIVFNRAEKHMTDPTAWITT
jgi:hypothetical protein